MSTAKTVYNMLREIQLVLDYGDKQLLAQYGLTVTRYQVMDYLGQHPGCSLSELSERLLSDKSNMMRMVRQLETSGLVVRKPHETDRRGKRLFLTVEGESLHSKIEKAYNDFNQIRFQSSLLTLCRNEVLPALGELRSSLMTELPVPEASSETVTQ